MSPCILFYYSAIVSFYEVSITIRQYLQTRSLHVPDLKLETLVYPKIDRRQRLNGKLKLFSGH